MLWIIKKYGRSYHHCWETWFEIFTLYQCQCSLLDAIPFARAGSLVSAMNWKSSNQANIGWIIFNWTCSFFITCEIRVTLFRWLPAYFYYKNLSRIQFQSKPIGVLAKLICKNSARTYSVNKCLGEPVLRDLCWKWILEWVNFVLINHYNSYMKYM